MLKPTISYSDVERVATSGSPALVEAFGRLLGIAPRDLRALGGDDAGAAASTAKWAVGALLVGAVVGAVAGARLERSHPGTIPEFIAGGRR